jgi:hypothetical protein
MLATTTRSPKSLPRRIGSVFRSSFNTRPTNRVERADFSRDARLLDASIAGIVLSFNPRDDEMRGRAARAWKTIRALLADHLFVDDDTMSPWNGDAAVGSATSSDILKKRYSEFRSLVRTVASVSFECGSDAEISSAGKALCRLAVKLDDLMERSERRLVNKLQQYVLVSREETRLSA